MSDKIVHERNVISCGHWFKKVGLKRLALFEYFTVKKP